MSDHYRIIQSGGHNDLARQVDELIATGGWLPFGAPYMAVTNDNNESFTWSELHHQAMVSRALHRDMVSIYGQRPQVGGPR